ncbi:MAG: glycosyl hydrolase family 18 protein, partial [Kiritimatiellae bacterium]|nr:glycosyl hydrolase family 18 protein [Kiritimatiellia bacterium]
MRIGGFFLFLILLAWTGRAEVPFVIPADVREHIGIHQEELEAHRAAETQSEAEGELPAVTRSVLIPRATGVGPQKSVFGWHPYWATQDDIDGYQYSNLTHIAYFSYEVNSTNGGCLDVHAWNTSPVVEKAHSNGVRVVLTATLFGAAENQRLLTNSTACQALIDNLATVVSNRGGDGVCIDFESVGSWSGATKALTSFMSNLTARFHRDLPDSEVSIALPSVDWYVDFDVAAYEAFGLDYAIIMGYDYYYSGSATPGPVAPLYGSAQWIGEDSRYSVDYSVSYYLSKGISGDHLMLAVPYYGRQWAAESAALGAASLGASYSSAKTYLQASGASVTYGRQWNVDGSTAYYVFTNTSVYQCFYDDAESLGMKYEYAEGRNLAGIGIWNLTQATEADELWALIDEWFGACSTEPPAPEGLTVTNVTDEAFLLSWNPAEGAVEYQIELTDSAWLDATNTCPAATLGFASGSGNGWYYAGTTVTAASGSVKSAPIYFAYPSSPYCTGHFLVGANGQSILSDAIAQGGETSSILRFTSGAWNAAFSSVALECTRVSAYFRVDDDGDWTLLGSQTASATGDGNEVEFSAALPPDALKGTNLYLKITAPNAEVYNQYLRGPYVHSLRLERSGSGGDYRVTERMPGYPKTTTAPSLSVTGLTAETRYYFRVRAVAADGTQSPWTTASRDTSAVGYDSNQNGFPDAWEIACFGTTTNISGSDDYDGDNMSNWAEYVAG